MKSLFHFIKVLPLLTALGFVCSTPVHAADYLQYIQCLSKTPVHFQGTIVDAVVQTCQEKNELCTLTNLVLAADLSDELSAPGSLTVYAPTDQAFKKIDPAVLTAIGSNIPLLTSVLTYHVSKGFNDPRRPLKPRQVTTLLAGQTVFFNQSKKPQVNQSNVDCQPIRTSNGTVWIIDSVLLPQFK